MQLPWWLGRAAAGGPKAQGVEQKDSAVDAAVLYLGLHATMFMTSKQGPVPPLISCHPRIFCVTHALPLLSL